MTTNTIQQSSNYGENSQFLLTEIVNVLKANNLKPSGNESRGYVAFCPKHDDTNTKSFSVGVGEKGLVMHCFANCSTYQQFKEWFTAKGVSFPKKAQAPDADGMVWKYITVEQWGVFPFKWPEEKAEPIMEKLYVYRRKDGTAYAFKMRFAPKDFRRFRIEGGKIKPSWRGLKMDPYNWDIACKAAAEGRPVVHVEGEKDADNVVEHLKYAAFSCGGVSDHWNDDWNADLEGAPGIIFVADNDLVKGNKKEPGLKKAQEYCEQVHKFKPVKLLMFNDHKDSTDFIKAGGTRADFTAKIKVIEEWKPRKEVQESNGSRSEKHTENATDVCGGKKRSQKDLLLECTNGIELWHDAEGSAYATIPRGQSIIEHLPLDSKSFSDWLCFRYFEEIAASPGREAIKECVGTLSGIAKFRGKEEKPEVRIAHRDGKIFLDLANKRKQVVEISESGWRLLNCSECQIRFIRGKTLRELPIPTRGGKLHSLFELLNLDTDHQKTLLSAWLLSLFQPPCGAFPILVLTGEQGTGKTFMARTIKQLIDPVDAPLRAAPKDERDLAIAAENSYVLAYDNLSGLPNWLSDVCCRVASGTGISTRELYSNREETTFETHRPILINGIDDPTSRDDFNDRVISLKLSAISDRKRQTEKSLEDQFNRIHAGVLGALLTAVSFALSNYENVVLETQVRMADFLAWCSAAERALGFQSGTIFSAYTQNRKELVEDLLETSALAQALLSRYSGANITDTATNILKSLSKPTDFDCSDWPKNPKQFGNQLKRLSPALRKVNFIVSYPPRTSSTRLISLKDERI